MLAPPESHRLFPHGRLWREGRVNLAHLHVAWVVEGNGAQIRHARLCHVHGLDEHRRPPASFVILKSRVQKGPPRRPSPRRKMCRESATDCWRFSRKSDAAQPSLLAHTLTFSSLQSQTLMPLCLNTLSFLQPCSELLETSTKAGQKSETCSKWQEFQIYLGAALTTCECLAWKTTMR